MNAFQKLLCLMKIQHNNLTTLHRNLVKDVGWFGNHSQLGEWYGALFDQLDDLTEIGISLGFEEPSIVVALSEIPGVLATESRELSETYRLAQSIIQAVIAAMEAAEAEAPPDVVNKLQEYIYYWRKESRYKLAHAIGAVLNAQPKIAEDKPGGYKTALVSNEEDD